MLTTNAIAGIGAGLAAGAFVSGYVGGRIEAAKPAGLAIPADMRTAGNVVLAYGGSMAVSAGSLSLASHAWKGGGATRAAGVGAAAAALGVGLLGHELGMRSIADAQRAA